MTTQAKPEPKKKNRSPELQAAGAAVALGKIDESIVRAKETLATKEAEKKAILDALEPNVRELLNRLRGTAKG